MATTAVAQRENTVKGYLEVHQDKVISVLPGHIDVERFVKSALILVSQNKTLQRCTPKSVFTAVLNAAELGLDFTPAKGLAYLVPYKNDATFMPGYRGLIDLAKRSGKIDRIEAHVVYDNDEFDIEYGTESRIVHKPEIRGERGDKIGAYAVAWFKDNSTQFEYMTQADIEHVQESSKTNSIWKEHSGEMWRKTVVRRLCKYLPISPDLAKALEHDNKVAGVNGDTKAGGTTADLESLVTGMNDSEDEDEPDDAEDAEYEDIPDDKKNAPATGDDFGKPSKDADLFEGDSK